MGRLMDKEDFLDTFGLNLSSRVEIEETSRWETETEEYTEEERKVLRDFENFLKESTLGEDSNFKKRLQDLCRRRVKKRKRKDEK